MVPLDEGQLLNIATRLNHGEVLYRDIYTGIFPGVYYVAAWLLALGGTDLVVTRWAQVLVNAATVMCLWTVTRRVTRPGWALVPVGLYLFVVVLSFPVLTMLNYSPLSLLFGLLTSVWLLRYLETARPLDGVGVGAVLAACALTKQNFGGLAFPRRDRRLPVAPPACADRATLVDRRPGPDWHRRRNGHGAGRRLLRVDRRLARLRRCHPPDARRFAARCPTTTRSLPSSGHTPTTVASSSSTRRRRSSAT